MKLDKNNPLKWRIAVRFFEKNYLGMSDDALDKVAIEHFGVTRAEVDRLAAEEADTFKLSSAREAEALKAQLAEAEAAARKAEDRAVADEQRRNVLVSETPYLINAIRELSDRLAELPVEGASIKAQLAEDILAFNSHGAGDPYIHMRINNAVTYFTELPIRKEAMELALELAKTRFKKTRDQLQAMK